MGRTIGIDLGTTNTCSAYAKNDHNVEVIESLDGHNTIPSVVSFKGGKVLTGRAAKREIHSNTDFTYRSFKRVIGRGYNEQEHNGFQMTQGPNGEVWYEGPDKRVVSPAELSSYIIKTCLKAAEQKLGERPDGVVLTHPAAFTERQRAATREAAQKAGISFDRIHLMQEPAAAALAYGIDKDKFSLVGVYDLGGGTFDSSLLRCGDTLNRVIKLGGNSNLGGDDFDEEIVDYVTQKWVEDGHDDLRAKDHCMVRVRMAAEDAKIALSTQEVTQVYLNDLIAGTDGLVGMDYPLSRAQFIEMTEHLIANSIDICERMISDAKIEKHQVHHLIMVGAMTRIPEIRQRVEACFGREAMIGITPEETVARGAAIQAAMIDGRIGGSTFINCSALSTGIKNHAGVLTVAIPKGVDLPFEKELIVGNLEAGQTCCTVSIFQGENETAEYNDHVVTAHVEFDEPLEAEEASIAVLVKQDKDGALSISVDGGEVYPKPEAQADADV